MAEMAVDSQPGSTIPIVIKHQGKTYNVDLDTSEPGSVFKYQVYSLTNVQPENQKILCRASQVKDDTNMAALRLKPGQVVMVLGQPGEAPTRLAAPKEKTRFLEDMTSRELAQNNALAMPVGLANLGNTCYLNSSLQVLRAIPEVQDSLANHLQPDRSNPLSTLAVRLREVFQNMATTGEAVEPVGLLTVLRTQNQRFAERSRTGAYAQQDAEEAWTFIINCLKSTLPVPDASEPTSGSSSPSVIDRYLTGTLERVTVCDDAEGNTEDSVKPEREPFRMLDCHISESVNHLRDGLLAGLQHKLEKSSDILGRTANFTSTDRLTQLPKYLSLHILRFSWKRTAQVSTKILRKVTFPQEFDISEMCTDELRAKLVPVREKVREIRKEMDEMERSRKKRKRQQTGVEGSSSKPETKETKETKEGKTKKEEKEAPEEEYKTDTQIEKEKQEALDKAKEELYELVRPQLETNKYANHTGLYQLRAVLTHQGSRSDSGHYTAFVKKGTILNPVSGQLSEEDGSWLWFNDDSVTEVPVEKIESLAGGGPSHAAFILLYSAVPLPLPENRVTEKFFQS